MQTTPVVLDPVEPALPEADSNLTINKAVEPEAPIV